jgi:hypothetical protein
MPHPSLPSPPRCKPEPQQPRTFAPQQPPPPPQPQQPQPPQLQQQPSGRLNGEQQYASAAEYYATAAAIGATPLSFGQPSQLPQAQPGQISHLPQAQPSGMQLPHAAGALAWQPCSRGAMMPPMHFGFPHAGPGHAIPSFPLTSTGCCYAPATSGAFSPPGHLMQAGAGSSSGCAQAVHPTAPLPHAADSVHRCSFRMPSAPGAPPSAGAGAPRAVAVPIRLAQVTAQPLTPQQQQQPLGTPEGSGCSLPLRDSEFDSEFSDLMPLEQLMALCNAAGCPGTAAMID